MYIIYNLKSTYNSNAQFNNESKMLENMVVEAEMAVPSDSKELNMVNWVDTGWYSVTRI